MGAGGRRLRSGLIMESGVDQDCAGAAWGLCDAAVVLCLSAETGSSASPPVCRTN